MVDFICAEAGLCNKLRSVLSYREAAVQRGRRLVVLWRLGAACDSPFEDLFEPLPGVVMLHGLGELPPAHREALAAGGGAAKASVYDSHPSIKYTETEATMYAALSPLPPVRAAAAANVAACGGAFVAVHMRRTDHTAMFGDRTPDEAFFTFLEERAPLPIFCATDNALTLREVGRRFPLRLRGAVPIPEPAGGEAEREAEGEARHTSVERAAVDLLTCVEATAFMGTYMSSFSDAIALLRRARGLDTSDDRHVVRSLGGKHYDPDVHSVALPPLGPPAGEPG